MIPSPHVVPRRNAELDLSFYDIFVVTFSGGKDSLAMLLYLLDCGVSKDRIELHHHDVDGGGESFMDWPITPAYCQAVATGLDIPLYFSGKEGGFLREMQRDETPTAPTTFQNPDGSEGEAGGRGAPGTRGLFPQMSGDLTVRWCSAYLKIDVMATVLRNSDRFRGARTLVLTGERGEESPKRATYQEFEPHRSDLRDGAAERHIDQWRPVLRWKEAEVWGQIKRWGIIPHPAYFLGWGRLSCRQCIFGSENQWATIRATYPKAFKRVAQVEAATGKTINRKGSVTVLANKGTPYEYPSTYPDLAKLADGHVWQGEIWVPPDEWALPGGAFSKEKAGPT